MQHKGADPDDVGEGGGHARNGRFDAVCPSADLEVELSQPGQGVVGQLAPNGRVGVDE